MNFNLRPGRPDDAMAIANAHLESWKTTYPGIVPQAYIDSLKVEDGARRMRELLERNDRHIFVAEDESGIFGFICGGAIREAVPGYDGELDAIYLVPRHQGQGAGSALVRMLAGALRAQGLTSMIVWALEANLAVHFYKRMGAVPVMRKTINIGGADLPDLALGWSSLDGLA
jgi:GNAT superfamily N-acetyltransferase